MSIDNVKTIIKRPTLGLEFAKYKLSQIANFGRATRTLPGDIKVTGFSGFSEFHSCARFVNSAELAFLSNCLKSDGEVIDVGSNLGVVSVILARRFSDRALHAFEPNPSTYLALRENLSLNGCGNAVAHGIAVADHNGAVPFEAHPANRGTAGILKVPSQYATTVPCITLDTFAKQQKIKTIAFLKVDVEGYETLVFRGASDLIGNHRAALIFFEVCPALTMRAGFAAEEPVNYLEQRGYRLLRLDEQGRLRPAESSEVSSVVSENWLGYRP